MSDQPTLRFPAPPEAPEAEKARRRWAVALLATLIAVLVALSTAVYLYVRAGDERATPAPPTAAPPAANTAKQPSTAPSESSVPDGRIPLAMLKESTLEVPPWPADNVRVSSGWLRFHDGVVALEARTAPPRTPPYGQQIAILAVTYGDVDRDGADETVAELGCLVEGGSKQLVAFDRDRSGRIVTIGVVVATTGEIRDLRDGSAVVVPDGTVAVQVGDYQRCCDDQTPQMWQRRGYRWHDHRFDQSTGPALMTANPYVTENRVTAGNLALAPAGDGYRYGTLDVTVQQVRGTRPDRIVLRFLPPAGLEPAGAGWPAIVRDAVSFSVTVDAPPARGSTTRTYAFRQPLTGADGDLDVEVLGRTDRVGTLSDTMPWDDGVTVTVRGVG
jgi:hypothetical protein